MLSKYSYITIIIVIIIFIVIIIITIHTIANIIQLAKKKNNYQTFASYIVRYSIDSLICSLFTLDKAKHHSTNNTFTVH